MEQGEYRFSPFPFLLFLLFPFQFIYAADTFRYDVSPELIYFDYSEYDENRHVLDEETGPLFGVRLSALNRQESFGFLAQTALAAGLTKYTGQTSSGSTEQSKTQEWIFDLRFAIDRREVTESGWSYGYRVGVGDRLWRRDIFSTESAIGILEYYNWPYVEIGAIAGMTLFNLPLLANISYQRVFLSRIFVEFKNNIPRVDFPTGVTNGLELDVESRFDRIRYVSNIAIFFRFWRSESSSSHVIPTTSISVREPSSDSYMYGIRMTFPLFH